MSNASASAFSLWSFLSILFLVFIIHHLWAYDRFKCLRWSAGRQPGAFKRVMTYSYVSAVPLLAIYSVGMTVIKVREGYTVGPGGAIIPVPIDFYRPENISWVLPLQFVFSFAWALEMVTHLEELAFWLYLLHQKPHKEAWFSSWEYRLWYLGSIVAVIGMPLTALITRNDLVTCDAYIFLVGSAGSTSTTVAFLYVLWRFPKFIRHVKIEGADPTVVVRLATFYQLNQARVVFRFLFTIPLLILALDGIVGHSHSINHNLFVTDTLQMISGIGCIVSSMITLLIFFPRSIVREAGYKPKVSNSVPVSPKGSPITPTEHGMPGGVRVMHSAAQSILPAHLAAYAHANGFRVSVTGRTTAYTTTGMSGWETEPSLYPHSLSAYSPRESIYDSPAPYSAEDGSEEHTTSFSAMQAMQKRASRRGSRRSKHTPHTLAEEDEDEARRLEEVEEGERRGKEPDDGRAEGAEDEEERAPPYQDSVAPDTAHPPQKRPFHHVHSSPQLRAHTEPLVPSTQATTDVKSKRRTWDWEERRLTGGANTQRASLHLIANISPDAPPVVGSGVSMNLVNLNPGPGAPVVGHGHGVGGSGWRGQGGGASTLHPYLVNFTSPIDLVDLPPHPELPQPR
ncbi:uncharacterized protein BXZ73DRAFT_45522 [Epithele typhae]|uniref:uncharacterized protein n=1 Tax=Epithele typhae TaxID=378194 RepID=UPI002007365B|nr:uncharacterized protein BXZ73DRAFT_45522 [Epithele typhae]KAH9935157.1 hypothetical protein BXZ73DRAFT_45522 [Epithele typhae]